MMYSYQPCSQPESTAPDGSGVGALEKHWGHQCKMLACRRPQDLLSPPSLSIFGLVPLPLFADAFMDDHKNELELSLVYKNYRSCISTA